MERLKAKIEAQISLHLIWVNVYVFGSSEKKTVDDVLKNKTTWHMAQRISAW